MLYNFYNLIMRRIGYDRQINRFLRHCIQTSSEYQNIIEFGCGTGVTGLTLLQIFPNADLVATDIKNHFLDRLDENIQRLNINSQRVKVGVSDISSPTNVRLVSGPELSHREEGYDIICAGANIGYSTTPEVSLTQLYELLKPGGVILNLEMNTRPLGRLVSAIYGYKVVSAKTFEFLAETHGARVSVSKVPVKYFPLSTTRTFVQIEKPDCSVRAGNRP